MADSNGGYQGPSRAILKHLHKPRGISFIAHQMIRNYPASLSPVDTMSPCHYQTGHDIPKKNISCQKTQSYPEKMYLQAPHPVSIHVSIPTTALRHKGEVPPEISDRAGLSSADTSGLGRPSSTSSVRQNSPNIGSRSMPMSHPRTPPFHSPVIVD